MSKKGNAVVTLVLCDPKLLFMNTHNDVMNRGNAVVMLVLYDT